MTEPNAIDQANPEAEVVDVVGAIADNNRAAAIDQAAADDAHKKQMQLAKAQPKPTSNTK